MDIDFEVDDFEGLGNLDNFDADVWGDSNHENEPAPPTEGCLSSTAPEGVPKEENPWPQPQPAPQARPDEFRYHPSSADGGRKPPHIGSNKNIPKYSIRDMQPSLQLPPQVQSQQDSEDALQQYIQRSLLNNSEDNSKADLNQTSQPQESREINVKKDSQNGRQKSSKKKKKQKQKTQSRGPSNSGPPEISRGSIDSIQSLASGQSSHSHKSHDFGRSSLQNSPTLTPGSFHNDDSQSNRFGVCNAPSNGCIPTNMLTPGNEQPFPDTLINPAAPTPNTSNLSNSTTGKNINETLDVSRGGSQMEEYLIKLRLEREREGRCADCGVQTHQVDMSSSSGRIIKSPLTVPGEVHRGRCLFCHPLPNMNHNVVQKTSHQVDQPKQDIRGDASSSRNTSPQQQQFMQERNKQIQKAVPTPHTQTQQQQQQPPFLQTQQNLSPYQQQLLHQQLQLGLNFQPSQKDSFPQQQALKQHEHSLQLTSSHSIYSHTSSVGASASAAASGGAGGGGAHSKEIESKEKATTAKNTNGGNADNLDITTPAPYAHVGKKKRFSWALDENGPLEQGPLNNFGRSTSTSSDRNHREISSSASVCTASSHQSSQNQSHYSHQSAPVWGEGYKKSSNSASRGGRRPSITREHNPHGFAPDFVEQHQLQQQKPLRHPPQLPNDDSISVNSHEASLYSHHSVSSQQSFPHHLVSPPTGQGGTRKRLSVHMEPSSPGSSNNNSFNNIHESSNNFNSSSTSLLSSNSNATTPQLYSDNAAIETTLRQMKDNALDFDQVLQSMHEFPSHPQLQEKGMGILWVQTYNVDTGTSLSDNGGVVTILQSMGNHPQSSRLQRAAFETLRNVCIHVPNRKLILDSGGVPAIIESMSNHLQDPRLQKSGCAVLAAIADGDMDCKIGVAESGGILAVMKAVETHADNDSVLRAAYQALRKLGYNPKTSRS